MFSGVFCMCLQLFHNFCTIPLRHTPDTPACAREEKTARLFLQPSVSGVSGVFGMEFTIPGCKPVPPLRVSSKMIHLTYAALYPGELTLGGVLAEARRWGIRRDGLREYAIGREKHSEPADPNKDEHFHVYLKYGKKVELMDRNHTIVFDLRGRNGRVLHPELQARCTVRGLHALVGNV